MIAAYIRDLLESPKAGVIRKMFEEGARLKKKYGAENVYDFSLGNPDLDPPDSIARAIERIASDNSHGTHGYMPNAGYLLAREAMAKKTEAEQGVSVPATHVVMSCGAAGALNVVLKSLLNAGDEVIVPSPYFTEYDHYIRNHAGTIVRVKTKSDFSLDCNAIVNALTEKTAAVLINSPNNPTGRIYSADDIASLSAALREHGKKCGRMPYLICDEPYRAITYGGKKVPPVFPLYENAVIVTSFAKNLSLPGERIGYLALNPACPEADVFIAAAIFSTRILGYVNAPAFFQKVVASSWNAPCDYSPYEKRCTLLKEIMDYAGLEYAKPDGAFYLFVKVPDAWNGDDLAFTNHLKKYNILCAPGSGFGGEGWFRIAYCVSERTIIDSRDAFYKAVHDGV
ncbi:pyridoxal phosphate-dependent aminotransferase [Treponema socranskii]|uniref:pyridoxal phosphate-dependent aminotransferase n=1 Tax=Treponema socranskii TaxID=53419 RepID=UPI003D93508D